jgi:hypothetical protein
MVGRCTVASAALLAALAFLLLFASGSNVEAVRYKIQYNGSLSCAGSDGVYGTGDDSCVEDPLYGPYGAGLTADMLSRFEIPDACGDGFDQDGDTVADDGCPQPGSPPAVGRAEGPHSNFSFLGTMGIPSNWWVATDSQIPNGALVGTLDSVSTLALFGGECTTTTPSHYDFYDCTTNNFEGVNDGCPPVGPPEHDHECNDNQDNDGDTTVNDGCPAVGAPETAGQCDNHDDDDGDGDPIVVWDESISGANLTYGHECGLPAACNKYPKHVNTILEGLRPRARYYGFTTVVDGMAPTHINFMIFNPEQLTELGVLPQADFNDDLGYINYVILENPLVPADPTSSLDEMCTPLITVTNLHGKTAGEGHLMQEVPPVPPDVGSFWTMDDPCGNGVDDDADTRIDEMCGFDRARNPEANTGFSTTGSHLNGAYSESFRDADGDTIPNMHDECPYVYDTGVDTDGDRIDDACDPTNSPGPMADEDDDGWRNQADNCPLVFQTSQANDADEDRIGDECDVGWDDDGDGAPDTDVNEECAEQQGCAELGPPEVICDGAEAGGQCANNTDDDGDGVVNDGCPANGLPESGHQCFNNIDDGEDWPAADGVVNDGCPAAALDDDGDTYVNDGCSGATAETGVQCLDGPRHPDGPHVNDYVVGSICIGAVDSDGDGWCDDTENLTGYAGQPISVASTTPEYDPLATPPEVEVDLNPVDGVKDCVDGLDNDGDGYIDGHYAPGGCQGAGCDAGCSTPEWRVIDPLIRAADNPPGQAPGTCSNRSWYDVDRLGGPEIDDDGDTVANLLDANACPGMKLDLQVPDLQPPTTYPLELTCPAVPGSTWHELWPTYSNNYTVLGHIDADVEGDTVLSQGDEIELDDGHWYHVDEVTATIYVKEKPDLIEEKYLEWYASAVDIAAYFDGRADLQDALKKPQGTQWHEAFPIWSQEYDLLAWSDNGDGVLSASDQVVLVNKDNPADIADYHVARVSIDIIVVQKPDGDIDQDHVPDTLDNCVDDWNPTQLDTDSDGTGDVCDTDDDNDAVLDRAEWAAGSDAKNVCDPRNFDLKEDGKISVTDVVQFIRPLKLKNRPCNPPKDYSICEPIYRSVR